MTKERPLACSLTGDELPARLAAIATIGRTGLISHSKEGDVHLLRFAADRTTRARLEEFVTAESKCCPFLDLSLSELGTHLLLEIAGPPEAQPIGDELAAAFAREVRSGDAPETGGQAAQ